jgi:hypothetical protein
VAPFLCPMPERCPLGFQYPETLNRTDDTSIRPRASAARSCQRNADRRDHGLSKRVEQIADLHTAQQARRLSAQHQEKLRRLF